MIKNYHSVGPQRREDDAPKPVLQRQRLWQRAGRAGLTFLVRRKQKHHRITEHKTGGTRRGRVDRATPAARQNQLSLNLS